MQIEIFDSYDQMSLYTAEKIADQLLNKPDSLICLASGDTPIGTFRKLVSIIKERQIDLSKANFVSLDEWVGIPPENEGSCQYSLRKHLYKELDLQPGQLHFFDSMAIDLAGECRKMDNFIQQKGGIDLILVGVGMNGHIGFNEPGVSPDHYAHVIELDQVTITVGQKYFDQATALRSGITLGLRYFMEAGTAIMIANGEKKASVIKATVEGPVSIDLPSSIIRNQPNGILVIDKAAASLLNS